MSAIRHASGSASRSARSARHASPSGSSAASAPRSAIDRANGASTVHGTRGSSIHGTTRTAAAIVHGLARSQHLVHQRLRERQWLGRNATRALRRGVRPGSRLSAPAPEFRRAPVEANEAAGVIADGNSDRQALKQSVPWRQHALQRQWRFGDERFAVAVDHFAHGAFLALTSSTPQFVFQLGNLALVPQSGKNTGQNNLRLFLRRIFLPPRARGERDCSRPPS